MLVQFGTVLGEVWCLVHDFGMFLEGEKMWENAGISAKLRVCAVAGFKVVYMGLSKV